MMIDELRGDNPTWGYTRPVELDNIGHLASRSPELDSVAERQVLSITLEYSSTLVPLGEKPPAM